MTMLLFLRFYWPIVFALVVALLYRKRIKYIGEFFMFSTLLLFGISRLIAIDIGPLLFGWFINLTNSNYELTSVLRLAQEIHIVGQIVAAVIGIVAVHWLARRYFELGITDGNQRLNTRSRTPEDRPVEITAEADDNLAQFLRNTSDGESP